MNERNSMQTTIQNYIKQVEEKRNITVILACETGSRAWGFPSPDSDYDVRVVYKHDIDWYLTIMDKKDGFDTMFEDREIDISGWELRKSLRLLYKSNAAMLERIQSPIIYQQDNAFVTGIREIAPVCYSKIATMYHYLGMANKCIADVDANADYKLKRFFYALRASTACRWILDNDDMPPIHFPTMLAGLDVKTSIAERIAELIAIKAEKSEGYFHTGEAEIIAFMQQSLQLAGDNASQLSGSKKGKDALNALFQAQVKNN